MSEPKYDFRRDCSVLIEVSIEIFSESDRIALLALLERWVWTDMFLFLVLRFTRVDASLGFLKRPIGNLWRGCIKIIAFSNHLFEFGA